MPTHPANPNDKLQDVIRRGGAVIVAGTGVSMAASWDASTGKAHPEASWAGLLENGLGWLKQHNLMPAKRAEAHLVFLKEDTDIHHFVSAAQDVTRLMGGVESKHFEDWLARTVGSIKAHDRKVLDALEALRACGNLLATTNYDGLLLDDAGVLKPVTWKEPDAFLRAARDKETDKVIFLHGYWRQPRSVVLDWNSYQEIARDERYREELATVWKMTTWLYVGCGVNGLNDPDFGLLLERYGKRARVADLWDFCLVRSSQRDEFQSHFDKLHVNICAVSFGDSHDQLPEYLRSLLPIAAYAKPVVAAILQQPVEPITEFLRVTDRFFQYRTPVLASGSMAPDGRGDFRFTAEEFRSGAVHRAQVVEVALQRLRRDGCVWLEGPSAGGKTTVCLHLIAEWNLQGCEPLYLDLAEKPDVEQAAREIAAHAKLGRMFILDNVHEAPKLACGLLDQWRAQRRDSVMVLLGWPVDVRPGHDYLSGHRGAVVNVAVQPEDWVGVYQSTFRHIRGATHVPPVPPAKAVKEWDNTFAADLVTFQYALAAGLRLGPGNAFEVQRAAADRYIKEKYLDPCAPEERADLFRLAWFSELDFAMDEELAPSLLKHSVACGLIRATLHGRFLDHVRFQPWHRSFARLLVGLAKTSERHASLSEAAVSFPPSAGWLIQRLCERNETALARSVIERTLDEHPNLIDWFGENISIGVSLFRHVETLTPSRWKLAVERTCSADEMPKLATKAFATPLNDLAPFLRFTGQSAELKPVHEALCKALVADAKLPTDQSRLQAQALTAPLHLLVTFLQFTGQSAQLKPVQEALCKALVADAKLPADQSRLQAQAFATPLHFLVTFLQFTGQSAQLKPVQEALCKALIADAKLPADQSRLHAQAFAVPLGALATFLRFTGQNAELKPVHEALCKALVADAKLPADQSRLQAQALTAPLGDLAPFLRFTGQRAQLKLVQEALCKALVADAKLPTDQSRLQAQAFTTPLHLLVTFLQFTGQSAELKPVHEALCKALVADAKLPADQSRLQAQAFTAPLHLLVTFLQFTGQSAQLKPVQEALCKALVADAKLPTDRSRLQAQAFATPLHLLMTFLQFTGQSAELKPVQEALCKALIADAKLSTDRSRLMRIARDTKENNLRGFVNGGRAIPEVAALGKIIESDPVCAKLLRMQTASLLAAVAEIKRPPQPTAITNQPPSSSSAPLQLRSALEERMQAGIEKVLVEAWEAVHAETAEEDRLKTARREAAVIISRLSPHIRRQVAAHFEVQKWEPLKARDPKVVRT